ncbi:MAG TPA: PH domain-containing protein [Longimicrobiales bacterium]|nr:PH domain-containing protein [Longimicrobiales bacterium]
MTTSTLTAPAPRTAIAPTLALRGTRRPARGLMWYYLLRAIATGPGIIVMLPLLWFRFRTLHYDFDEEGVTVRWGILFRREVTLTFARIQDIHLNSNVVERWLGLGRIDIQTASGQAGAEATIEGLHDFEAVRDALYMKMRGARGLPARTSPAPATGDGMDDVAAALREAVAEMRALRTTLERGQS